MKNKKKHHIVTLKETTYNNLLIRRKIASDEIDSHVSFDSLVRIALQKNAWWIRSKDIKKKMKEVGLESEEE